jgi:GntR family phosphonate transport system transcriptional regulator
VDRSQTEIFEATREAATAWRRIADDLARAILQGSYDIGSVLPPAQDLARQNHVHRHTVRQAYKHLEVLGLVKIQQGRGTFVTGARLPYRLGRRVRFRENLRALDVPAIGQILSSCETNANAAQARELALEEAAPLWRIETLNGAAGRNLSLGIHLIGRARFPDFPAVLMANNASFTAGFLACGIPDYERHSTRIGARMASLDEAAALCLGSVAVVLETHAIDCDPLGAPLQIVDAVFVAERVEFLLER